MTLYIGFFLLIGTCFGLLSFSIVTFSARGPATRRRRAPVVAGQAGCSGLRCAPCCGPSCCWRVWTHSGCWRSAEGAVTLGPIHVRGDTTSTEAARR